MDGTWWERSIYALGEKLNYSLSVCVLQRVYPNVGYVRHLDIPSTGLVENC